MKKFAAVLVFVSLVALPMLVAQTLTYPPPARLVYTGSAGNYTPVNLASGTGQAYTVPPTAFLAYCGTGPYTVCNFSGGSGGTITGVTAGTGLTGGGTTGTVTLNLDTTKVPQFTTANTFTNTNTFTGVTSINPVIASAGGDMLCAHAADTSIASTAVTATSFSSPNVTFTVASVPNAIYPGSVIGYTLSGTTTGPYTVGTGGTSTTVVANTGTTLTSGGNIFLWCSNQSTDAITNTAFANVYALPANYFTGSAILTLQSGMSIWSSATAPTVKFMLYRGSGAQIFSTSSIGTAASLNGVPISEMWQISGLTTTLWNVDNLSYTMNSTSTTPSTYANTVRMPISVTSAAAANLIPEITFTASGIGAFTYTSGITATGTVGQTCILNTFNGTGGSGATATLALTGTNTIAAGTAGVITNTGIAFTAVSTSATVANGTATCTGPATISMAALGGAQGNAIYQRQLTARNY